MTRTSISLFQTGLLLFTLTAGAIAQDSQGGGTIYFVDGTTQTFSAVIRMHHEATDDAKALSPRPDGLQVYYKNTYRSIPYNKLVSIEIRPVKISNGFVHGSVTVVTKTGIEFTSPITVSGITVSVYDELTGDVAQQGYQFCKGTTLTVKKVVFD